VYAGLYGVCVSEPHIPTISMPPGTYSRFPFRSKLAGDWVKVALSLQVNGERHELFVAVHKTLLEVLREDLELTGTKHGCELGECGACAVLIDGQAMLSCLALPIELGDAEIVTIEGLSQGAALHPLQETFAELGAAQCGYCTPGFLVTAKALLDRSRNPTRQQIAEALSGNICRCTGYVKIFEAVELAAHRLGGLDTGTGELEEIRA
jgi:aerobic-type carbon monoxide dehydrogenase small subunit (CoxS/CutS family)